MRKSFLLLSIISLFSFLTISCRKEDSFCMQENIVINDLEEEYPELLDFLQEDENSRTVLPKDSNYIEQGYYAFFYNNKKYECNYSISKDSTVVFDNPEVKVLFDKLKDNSNISISIDGDCIKIYDSNDDLKEDFLKSQAIQLSHSRVGEWTDKVDILESISFSIYRHRNFRGRSKTYNATNSFNDNDLDKSGLDKKVSSFKYYGKFKTVSNEYPVSGKKICHITLYSEKDCKGFNHDILVTAKRPNGQIKNMKDIIPFGPYLNENWNDRARSLSVSFY